MPELPEVETVVRGLRPHLPGRRIVRVELGKTDFMDDPAALERELPGRRIADVTRAGKYIRVALEAHRRPALSETKGHPGGDRHPQAKPEQTPARRRPYDAPQLIIHLGMTGRLGVHRAGEPLPKHTHFIATLDDARELRFTDPRRFGQIFLTNDGDAAEWLAPLGPEPLEVTAAEFRARLAGRDARIKSLLLDQRFLRGVGNIYADEALWRARIHPLRRAGSLTRAAAAKLRSAVQRVLRKAIARGGSSISDFLNAEGRPGSYQREHCVYGREGEPCLRCRARIQRIVVAGRSSHFCPRCQKTKSETRKSKLENRKKGKRE